MLPRQQSVVAPSCRSFDVANVDLHSSTRSAGAQMSAATNPIPTPGRSTSSSVVQPTQLPTTHTTQHFGAPPLKTDEIEIIESAGGEELSNDKVRNGFEVS